MKKNLGTNAWQSPMPALKHRTFKGFCALLLAAFGGMGYAQDALVQNGTFDATEGAATVGWKPIGKKYVFRDGVGRSGTRALCYENDDPAFYSLPRQTVTVRAGKIYEFEVWVRTENLVGDECGATICMEWSDAKGKWLGGAYVKGVKGTHDWTRVSGLTARIPAEAHTVRVSPYVRKGMTGKAWFDDVQVREFVQAPVTGLYSTAYRNLAAEGTVTFHAALNLDPVDLDDRCVTLRYVDATGTTRTQVVSSFNATQASVALNVGDLRRGAQTVRVEVVNRATWQVLGSAETTFTRVDKLPRRTVCFDRLGRTLVNGQPFFPLGMYWPAVTTNKLAIYAKGPFNCLMPYSSPKDTRLLDLCHAKGLKVIYSVKDIYAGTKWAPSAIKTAVDEERYLVDCVARFKNHPAILAWYLNDELPLSMLPRLAARRALMEKLDPEHPGWTVLYQSTQIRDYLSSFDVIGTDPYPIPDRPALLATTWTRSTVAGTMGCKPVWQVPQAFNWGVYRKKNGDRKSYRAPTENELRSMCWQCIANGANGLVLYSFFDLFKPSPNEPFERRWAECCRVGAEIRKFIPVLLSDERADRLPVKALADAEKVGRTVSVRSWWKNGAAWVLVVNGGDESVTAEIRLHDAFARVTCELGENGTRVNDRTLRVKLSPLAVSFLRIRSNAAHTAD